MGLAPRAIGGLVLGKPIQSLLTGSGHRLGHLLRFILHLLAMDRCGSPRSPHQQPPDHCGSAMVHRYSLCSSKQYPHSLRVAAQRSRGQPLLDYVQDGSGRRKDSPVGEFLLLDLVLSPATRGALDRRTATGCALAATYIFRAMRKGPMLGTP